MSSNVLDGFDKTEGIVGIIIENNKEILYFADGSKTEKPMQLFTLATFPGLYSKQGKLKGELYYQYAYVFDKVSVFNSFVKNNRDVIKTYRDLIQNTMVSRGMRMYKGLELTRLNILSWDIETTGLDPRAPDAKVIMITNTFENSKGEIIRKLFSFDEYEHEGEMIRAWCRWVQEINPDIILGHNIYSFDIPYMIERAANFGTKLFLGREGRMLQVETMKRKYRLDMGRFLEYEMPIIPGRECIDTLLLAYKSDTGKRYESYGLKWLIKFEKLEQPNRVFYDASKIRVNYKIPGEMEKIKAYAERDADDGLALFKLLITPYYYMCTFIPMTLSQLLVSASGSQLDTSFVSYYLCHGHSIPNTTKKHNIKGALSFGNPGIYKNVWSFDLASMHPSIIIQYRVSDPKKDPLEIIWNYTKILRERRFYHKKMGNETGDRYHKDMDKSLKILINSIFGMQGTEGLCFNNPKGAEFILWMSRKILTTCMDWAKNDFEQVERDKISYDQGKYVDWLKGDFT